MYLLDTFAWIEFFRGGRSGKTVEKLLLEKTCYTSQISLAEVASLIEREKGLAPHGLEFVKQYGNILPLTNDLLENAGRLHAQRRKTIPAFGLIDAIILSTAMENRFELVTGDPHFNDLPNIVWLDRFAKPHS